MKWVLHVYHYFKTTYIMKKFILLSVVLLAVSASVSARINPEDYGNIRVDTIWWEGPPYRHYTKIMHMVITNAGTKKIEGSLWTADRYTTIEGSDGKPLSFYYCHNSFSLSLMPNETQEYTCRFTPYYDFITEGQTENISHFCLLAEDDTLDEVFSRDFVFGRTSIINNRCVFNISGIDINLNSGIDYTKIENIPSVANDLPVMEWTYENLEDFPVFDICGIGLYSTRYSNGEFEPVHQIGGQVMFESIDKGETVTGTFIPEHLLSDGGYYMIQIRYGFYINESSLGILWQDIQFANEPFIFKVDMSSGIKDIRDICYDKPIYTLGGIRIADTRNLPKGIYIRNGKKFVVK